MSTDVVDPTERIDIPLLPERPRRAGPVTTALLARTALLVALVEVAAVACVVGGGALPPVAGAGLVFPGGGFLYTGHPVVFALVVAGLALAVVLWWAISLWWGIPALWATSAVAAVAVHDRWPESGIGSGTWGWSLPLLGLCAAATALALVGSFERRFRAKRARIPELNDYLRAVGDGTATVPDAAKPVRQPNDVDAALLAWCHELALQPLDEFRGFEWGEQFHGGTCVRYQLNYLGWALSTYAVNYVPNAPNTIEQVLRNLVLKQTDLRVWRYWRTLNVLGNGQADPDPIAFDNIMFSGFTGDQINLYEAATGSTRFDEPGSLTFVWSDGHTFAYDHHSWMAAVRDNFDRSRMGFFPCEPGWAFAACNTIGAQALLGYDRLHGTSLWSDYEPRWRAALLDEYLLPDGNRRPAVRDRGPLAAATGRCRGAEPGDPLHRALGIAHVDRRAEPAGLRGPGRPAARRGAVARGAGDRRPLRRRRVAVVHPAPRPSGDRRPGRPRPRRTHPRGALPRDVGHRGHRRRAHHHDHRRRGRHRHRGDRAPPTGAAGPRRRPRGGPVISMFVNCAKAWVTLVQAYHRVTRRPQVTFDRPPRTSRSTARGGRP